MNEMTKAHFQLSQADQRPMYVQIMQGVKQCVVSKEWPAGYALPSIREMAVALQVSVITVKRAYQELDREGIIVTRHGMGSYVAENTEAANQKVDAELTELLDDVVKKALLIGVPEEGLVARLKSIYAKHQKSSGE